jgi:hypothetical protein
MGSLPEKRSLIEDICKMNQEYILLEENPPASYEICGNNDLFEM